MRRNHITKAICTSLAASALFAFTPSMALAADAVTTAAATGAAQEDRLIVLTGTVQRPAGAARDWDPADTTTCMKDVGGGFYEITIDLPAGTYYYKVSCGGSWAENYGLDGNFDGANIQLTLEKPQTVTFYYNDMTHRIANSTAYTWTGRDASPQLSGDFLASAQPMADRMLDAFYQVEASVPAGTHEAVVSDGGETIRHAFTMKDAGTATFYYDGRTKKIIVDDGRIKAGDILHDTWESAFRAPFEAVEAGSPVTLSILTGAGEVDAATLILRKATLTAKGGDEYNPDFAEDAGATREEYAMEKIITKEGKDVWRVTIRPETSGIYGYTFLLNGVKAYGDDAKPGHTGEIKLRGAKPFQLTVCERGYHTPDWAKEAVCYQIFPDRFRNGDPSNDAARDTARGFQPVQHKAWTELPANHGKTPDLDADAWECNDFFGGDLKGIEQKLDYLKDMGFTAIYVNPLSSASSNHRYDARDYGAIDPMLGTAEDFASLVRAMDVRGMRLIMDGVFNHVGDDSVYFDRYGKYDTVGAYEYWSRIYDLQNAQGMPLDAAKREARRALEAKGQKFSPFGWEDWFDVKNEKARDMMGEKYAYHDWQGFDSLVPFRDGDYPAYGKGRGASTLGDYLLYGTDTEKGEILKWFDNGLSGWRLDVAKEIPPGFWQNVRKAVKGTRTANGDEPLLLGEIWQDGSQFLTGDMFDSVMNYKLSFAVGDLFLMQGDAQAADEELKVLRQNYPKEALYDLMNIVGSHDTVRAIYKFGGGSDAVAQPTKADFDYDLGKARMKLAIAFLMGYPGMPTIYYGDEAGLYGGTDPDDRRTFPWGAEDADLQSFTRRAIAVRNGNLKLFAHGDVKTLYAKGSVYAFARTAGDDAAIVALNRGEKESVVIDAPFADGTKFRDALAKKSFTVKNGKLTLPLGKLQAMMLVKE